MTSPDLTLLPASPRRAFARRLLRYLGTAGVVVLVALAGTAGWLYLQMRGSLAQLDGEAAVPGATAAIVIERDALGVPTIAAASRADAARGLGLLRRNRGDPAVIAAIAAATSSLSPGPVPRDARSCRAQDGDRE